ncbi:DNA-formamidopyrimidine glycosylase family protein, partial [Salmonella enterica]|uniref:DNA-formamidopyrimidine glycosylase family protein n=1 Tax=Salmonella enterica TaxID=28901 RepID=UPI00398C6F2C
MPQLETRSRSSAPHIVRATNLHDHIRNTRILWPGSDIIHRLRDPPRRRGPRSAKYLLLELPDAGIIIHRGMPGTCRKFPEPRPAEKPDKVVLGLRNAKILRYPDPRALGAGLGTKELEGITVWAHRGPDRLGAGLKGKI